MSVVRDVRLEPGQGVVTWRAACGGQGNGQPLEREFALRVGRLWEREQRVAVTVFVGGQLDATESGA